MKKSLLFILLFITYCSVQAQFTVSTEDTTLTETVMNDDMHIEFEVVNTSSSSSDITWTRDLTGFKTDWVTYVCDPKSCYLPFASTAVFTLDGGAKGIISVHVDPKSIAGSSSMIITISDVNGNSKPVKVNFVLGEQGGETSLVLEHNPSEVRESDASKTDIIAETNVTNSGSTALTTTWTRTFVDIPDGWVTYICDTKNCYPPNKGTANFTLDPSVSGLFSAHVNPKGIAGKGVVKVDFTESETVKQVGVFMFDIGVTSTGELETSSILLFPNPTTGAFTIETENTTISHIDIYNVLGRKVQSFDGATQFFDISNQPKGIYLIQMVGLDNKVLNTIRLSKVNP